MKLFKHFTRSSTEQYVLFCLQKKKLQSEMFKKNIVMLRYCAFKMSLMSNINRYTFPSTFKLENVKKCENCMQCF